MIASPAAKKNRTKKMYEGGNERLLCVSIEIIASVTNSHT